MFNVQMCILNTAISYYLLYMKLPDIYTPIESVGPGMAIFSAISERVILLYAAA